MGFSTEWLVLLWTAWQLGFDSENKNRKWKLLLSEVLHLETGRALYLLVRRTLSIQGERTDASLCEGTSVNIFVIRCLKYHITFYINKSVTLEML
jgi:hypothetical protein